MCNILFYYHKYNIIPTVEYGIILHYNHIICPLKNHCIKDKHQSSTVAELKFKILLFKKNSCI